MLIETLQGSGYSRVDDRAFGHPGCIVDLGCNGWDWGSVFFGRKRIIGADPFAEPKDGAMLYQGVVGPFNGTADISRENFDSSAMSEIRKANVETFPMLCWRDFCARFSIGEISVLKLNIEGAEYPLLSSMDADDFTRIDQIAVSFHDWLVPGWRRNTESAIAYLESHGFGVRQIDERYGWWLALKERCPA